MKTVIKSGRLSSGLELGKGKVVHLNESLGWNPALYGAVPGRRSGAGFIETEMIVNCPKCIKKELLNEKQRLSKNPDQQ